MSIIGVFPLILKCKHFWLPKHMLFCVKQGLESLFQKAKIWEDPYLPLLKKKHKVSDTHPTMRQTEHWIILRLKIRLGIRTGLVIARVTWITHRWTISKYDWNNMTWIKDQWTISKILNLWLLCKILLWAETTLNTRKRENISLLHRF